MLPLHLCPGFPRSDFPYVIPYMDKVLCSVSTQNAELYNNLLDAYMGVQEGGLGLRINGKNLPVFGWL
jgi:hypothetical protein